jgi:hypothetical protein
MNPDGNMTTQIIPKPEILLNKIQARESIVRILRNSVPCFGLSQVLLEPALTQFSPPILCV